MKILALCFIFFQVCANAKIVPEGNLYITQINAKLREISNAKVEFRQNINGKTEKGVIFYKKDRGLFMKYQTMPVSILVTNIATTYYDSKLEQKSQIPTQKSAARIFTSQLEINNNTFDIQKIEELPEAIVVRASIKNLKNEGIFSMYFSKTDFLLRRVDIESPETHEKNRIDLYSYSFAQISDEKFKSINIERDLK